MPSKLQQDFVLPSEVIQYISAEQAFHYRIVPMAFSDGILCCLTDHQSPESLARELHIILGYEVALEPTPTKTFQDFLTANYRNRIAPGNTTLHYSEDFLEQMIHKARELGSSDIHFEPYEKNNRVRFRLDGKLLNQFTISKEEYPSIINKIKIRAGLDIAEKRLPQDGRISMQSASGAFDLRVSTLPTLFGEKIVLRILNRSTQDVRLEELGFNPEELDRYIEGTRNPSGIILISGPTGSGKTTTLYATLKLLNSSEANILTIEDPIEYTLEGINQVQLKENIGLDFASAMRTFLRQDPDIIMVGEIRDVKTANMAIRAALTGHLVLSTIHTNSAWATVSRLVDMGIPPFLIASTLNLSVAQRLVRQLCSNCKQEQSFDVSHFPKGYAPPFPIQNHHVATGCPDCFHTGYKGRIAVYEVIPITTKLVSAIKENRLEIQDYLKENKIPTLGENALNLVQKGITSIAEIYPLLTN